MKYLIFECVSLPIIGPCFFPKNTHPIAKISTTTHCEIITHCDIFVASSCSGYHYCTTSFSKAWAQVLHRFKSCLQRIGDSRWWRSLTMVLAGNKVIRLSSINHTTKTIHYHHHHYHPYSTAWNIYELPLGTCSQPLTYTPNLWTC